MTDALRWGVLGTARIAEQKVVPAISASRGGDVLAVSSGSGRQGQFAARLGIPRSYSSHSELLEDPDVDAVYIPLPNSLHLEWVLRAAAAGKHVLCEKPLALDSSALRAAQDACSVAGVQLAEAFMYRHHPQLDVVRRLLRDRTIGDLVAVEASFHFRLDRAAGPDIRLEPALGGGALMDVGCYPVDAMNLLLGGPPDEVLAMASSTAGAEVETGVQALTRWGDVMGSWSVGFDAPAGDSLTLLGSAGTVAMRHPFRPDLNGDVGVVEVTLADGTTTTVETQGDPYLLEVEDFARRVHSGETDMEGARLSDWTATTLERVAQAAGLPVRLRAWRQTGA